MNSETKNRMIKYLERHYEDMSSKEQTDCLNRILKRILGSKDNFFDEEQLLEMVQELKKENWTIESILAHMDLIDYEDRT